MNTSSDLASTHVIVVGGGLIGLFSSHFLVERGHRVTVVERSAVGSGASRVNGGWICPARSDPMASTAVVRDGLRSLVSDDAGFFMAPRDFATVAEFLLRFLSSSRQSSYLRSWDELDVLNHRTNSLVDQMEEAGLFPGLQNTGFLILHQDRAAAEASHAAWTRIARRGLAPAPEPIMDRTELLAVEPDLGQAARYGFLHRGDRWLDPGRFVDTLTDSLRKRGVEFVAGCTVTALTPEPGSVCVHTSTGVREGTHAVLAAGAWSGELLSTVGVRGVVAPGKGYSFSAFPRHMPAHVLRLGNTHIALTPMGDRARLAGIVEFDGTYERLNRERIHSMKRRAAPYLTGIDWDACTDERVAPRPMTPDGKPLIGCAPHSERVIIATGHNMLGLSLGPSTGQLVADLVDHGRAAAPRAFEPGRFSAPTWRRLRTRTTGAASGVAAEGLDGAVGERARGRHVRRSGAPRLMA